jgi:LuxR family transcriptional regulator of csgAB operon
MSLFDPYTTAEGCVRADPGASVGRASRRNGLLPGGNLAGDQFQGRSSIMEIYILGPMRLQNELVARRLEQETGLACLTGPDLSTIAPAEQEHNPDRSALILWDCQGRDSEELLSQLRSFCDQTASDRHLALFNVDVEANKQQEYVWEGAEGIFYDQDPLDLFLKGVHTLLKGELWLSRDIMTRCIKQGSSRSKLPAADSTVLSPRQEEILALVAVGATNDEIADKLCISPHTVKTHLYNIYKKINVPNRFQAALWAAKNL